MLSSVKQTEQFLSFLQLHSTATIKSAKSHDIFLKRKGFFPSQSAQPSFYLQGAPEFACVRPSTPCNRLPASFLGKTISGKVAVGAHSQQHGFHLHR